MTLLVSAILQVDWFFFIVRFPDPIAYFRQIFAVFIDMPFVLDQFALKLQPQTCALLAAFMD